MEKVTRRKFIQNGLHLGAFTLAQGSIWKWSFGVPNLLADDKLRPRIPFGVQTGDVTSDRAIVWSRVDRPGRMWVEYATNEGFRNSVKLMGPAALEPDDFTAKIDLTDLPKDQKIFCRVQFESLESPGLFSHPIVASFRTAPTIRRDILFVWGGDTAGQGFGINPDFGGMKIYKSMRKMSPDFFIHSGDMIYADGPLQSEVRLSDGSTWKNIVTPEKAKVAETLDEFRGNYRYNLMDENVRKFNAEVPMWIQWDDHEVRNNWYPRQMIEQDDRYKIKSIDLLSARAKRALVEYTPLRTSLSAPEKIFRSFSYGPSLDVFMVDLRTYRGPNTGNQQTKPGLETSYFGQSQLNWLKEGLKRSTATWKVVASDMPIGLIVPDGKMAFENSSNGPGVPKGRELELVELFKDLKSHGVRNVVWITADVHYAAAHYYDPSRATFSDFLPFWEFVAGPLNAGTFGPNELDPTFGPSVKFQSVPSRGQEKLPPSAGLQFFGSFKINKKTEVATIQLRELSGKTIYTLELEPQRQRT